MQKLRDWRKDHDVPSAIMLMKQMAGTKFVESAEAHFRLNLDPKYADQQLRASVCSLICTLFLLIFIFFLANEPLKHYAGKFEQWFL